MDDKMEKTNAIELIVRGIEAIEASSSRLSAVEKSVDGLKAVVESEKSQLAELKLAVSQAAASIERASSAFEKENESRRSIIQAALDSPVLKYLIYALLMFGSSYMGIHYGQPEGPAAVESRHVAPAIHEAGATNGE